MVPMVLPFVPERLTKLVPLKFSVEIKALSPILTAPAPAFNMPSVFPDAPAVPVIEPDPEKVNKPNALVPDITLPTVEPAPKVKEGPSLLASLGVPQNPAVQSTKVTEVLMFEFAPKLSAPATEPALPTVNKLAFTAPVTVASSKGGKPPLS